MAAIGALLARRVAKRAISAGVKDAVSVGARTASRVGSEAASTIGSNLSRAASSAGTNISKGVSKGIESPLKRSFSLGSRGSTMPLGTEANSLHRFGGARHGSVMSEHFGSSSGTSSIGRSSLRSKLHPGSRAGQVLRGHREGRFSSIGSKTSGSYSPSGPPSYKSGSVASSSVADTIGKKSRGKQFLGGLKKVGKFAAKAAPEAIGGVASALGQTGIHNTQTVNVNGGSSAQGSSYNNTTAPGVESFGSGMKRRKGKGIKRARTSHFHPHANHLFKRYIAPYY